MRKKCPRCGRTLPLEKFSRNSYKPDGHGEYCRPCGSDVQREWQDRTRKALLSDPNHHLHGHVAGYNLGCRCEKCMKVKPNWSKK